MKKILFAASIAIIAFTTISSCKKGDNEKLEGPNESVKELMSTKEGSYWLYSSNEGTVTRRYATGRDTTMLGNTFDFYEKTDTVTKYVTPEFFGKNGDNYLMLVDMEGSMTEYMNVIVSKTIPKPGDEWTNTADKTYSSIPFKLKTDGKIVSTGGSIELNGVTYNNVVEAENKLGVKVTGQPTYTNCGKIKMWFVEGIGNIKTEFDIDIKLLSMSVYKRYYVESLIEYHIEP